MMDPDNKEAQKNFFFGGIEGCKFRRPVVPGDTLVNCHTMPAKYHNIKIRLEISLLPWTIMVLTRSMCTCLGIIYLYALYLSH